MVLKRMTLCLSLSLCIGLSYGHAQQGIVTTGGDASGTTGSMTYSVGQVFYTVAESADGSMSQGVQHGYEIYLVGTKDPLHNISLSVFPNPTTDRLTLQVRDLKNKNLTYQLFDMQGNLLKEENLEEDNTQIQMSDFPTATYFLNIIQGRENIESFKIIKTN